MRVRAVHRVARQQDGLITRTQALNAGATPAMVRHALRNGGSWQVVLPGVYATFTGPLGRTHRLRAAVLHGGAGSMVTGPVACELLGLEYGPNADGIVDVLVCASRKVRDVAFVRVHRTVRLPARGWWLDTGGSEEVAAVLAGLHDDHGTSGDLAQPGLVPIAPASRVVIDTVCWMPPAPAGLAMPERLRPVRALVCEAVQKRRCRSEDLNAELRARSRQGTARVRRVMADVAAGCRSAPECELRDLLRTSRILPEPRWNKPLPGHGAISPDACLSAARLVIEVDSVAWHRYGDRYELTEKRRALYARLGWTVIPVSPFRLRTEPGQVLREIEQAYLAGLRRHQA